MAGWYAQKHPDEDFAETFAVWLTPRSQWRKRYKGWDALAKLQYVDRIARKVGDVEPIRRRGRTDITVDEMESTVGEFYRLSLPEEIPVQELALDADLADIFNISPKRRKGVRPAQEMLRQHRKPIVDKVAYWSGVQRPIVKRLVEAICKRVEELGLRVDVRRESEYLTEFTVYTTALCNELPDPWKVRSSLRRAGSCRHTDWRPHDWNEVESHRAVRLVGRRTC